MLKSYNPVLDNGKHHVVEATYMVSDAKIIVRWLRNAASLARLL